MPSTPVLVFLVISSVLVPPTPEFTLRLSPRRLLPPPPLALYALLVPFLYRKRVRGKCPFDDFFLDYWYDACMVLHGSLRSFFGSRVVHTFNFWSSFMILSRRFSDNRALPHRNKNIRQKGGKNPFGRTCRIYYGPEQCRDSTKNSPAGRLRKPAPLGLRSRRIS